MEILIGMDEAGYGPNFGPLVVAATAWCVEDAAAAVGRVRTSRQKRASLASLAAVAGASESGPASRTNRLAARGDALPEVDLYRVLRAVVVRAPREKRIAIADSKLLYRPGLGLRQLERGVHAALHKVRQAPCCWNELVSLCEADPDKHHRRSPWLEGFDCRLPVDAEIEELSQLGATFSRTCDGAGARPLAIRARYVFPAEFNELTDRYGTKGAALSHVTVGLLREVIDSVASDTCFGFPTSALRLPPSVAAVCDKHGGRNYYAALLQHHFSEHWIEPVVEGGRESRYEWGPAESRVRVSFRVGGEAFLPTALASMTAKYLRELAMRAFNEFWCGRVPGLKPTAGYPLDAWRYRQEIAAAQRELKIDDHVLWRNR